MPYEKKVSVPHFTSQFKQVVDLLVYLKRQPDFFQVNNLADALIHPDRPKKRRRLDELVESREAAKEVLDQIVDGDEVWPQCNGGGSHHQTNMIISTAASFT